MRLRERERERERERGALSFFTFPPTTGLLFPLLARRPSPLPRRLRDQQQQHLSCFPRKRGCLLLLSKLAREMTRSFLEFISFVGDGRREKGQIRGMASIVGIAMMGRIQCHIVRCHSLFGEHLTLMLSISSSTVPLHNFKRLYFV